MSSCSCSKRSLIGSEYGGSRLKRSDWARNCNLSDISSLAGEYQELLFSTQHNTGWGGGNGGH